MVSTIQAQGQLKEEESPSVSSAHFAGRYELHLRRDGREHCGQDMSKLGGRSVACKNIVQAYPDATLREGERRKTAAVAAVRSALNESGRTPSVRQTVLVTILLAVIIAVIIAAAAAAKLKYICPLPSATLDSLTPCVTVEKLQAWFNFCKRHSIRGVGAEPGLVWIQKCNAYMQFVDISH